MSRRPVSNRAKRALVLAILAGAAAEPSIASAQILADWVGPASGDWSVNGNWSTGAFPNAANIDARLLGDFNVTIGPGLTRNVRRLELASAATLNISDNTFLQINGGGIDNAGAINVNAGANSTRLRLFGAQSLTGGGTINLNNGTIDGNGQVITNVDNLIVGTGILGGNTLQFDNRGTIRAQGGTLTLDPSSNVAGAEFFNTGTLAATGSSSVLVLTGFGSGEFDNTGGVIRADAGAVVSVVTNANITGGTFLTTGGGVIEVAQGNIGRFNDITNNGAMVGRTNSDFDVFGTLINNGTITIDTGDGARADLELQGDTTFNGTGSVILQQGGVNGTGVLTIGAGQTFRGSGTFGQNTLSITNRGTIRGNLAGQDLRLDPRSAIAGAELLNSGLIQAANGGSVTLTGFGNGEFSNLDPANPGSIGVMEATGTGSRFILENAQVFNGTLRGTSGGIIYTPAGNNTFVTDVRLEGSHLVDTNSDFGIDGTVTLASGSNLRLIGSGAATDLEVQSTAALAGNGTVQLDGPAAGINGSGTLNIASGVTIRGEGRFGQNTISVANSGTILADVSGGTLRLDPASVTAGREFDNNGTIRAQNGGNVAFTGFGNGEFANDGGLIEAVGAGSTVQLTGFANLDGGIVRGLSGGSIVVGSGENVFVSNLTLSGPTSVGQNTDFGIDGTVVNDGVITLDGSGAATDLEVQAGATLAGSGELVLAGPAAGINGSGTLLNDSGNTIRGQGRIGQNTIQITNDGFIIADIAGQELVLDPASVTATAEFVNNGTLRAENGGILVFDGFGNGEFLNNNEISVANGGQILFRNNAQLTNASTASSNRLIGGTFRVFDNGVGTTFNIVPPNFDLEVNQSATVEIQGPNVISNLFDDAASSGGNLVSNRFRQNGGTFIIGGGTNLTVNTAAGVDTFVNAYGSGSTTTGGTFFVDAGSTASFTHGDPATPSTFDNTGGTLGGAGTLDAIVTGTGTLAPGNSNNTPGTLNIASNGIASDIAGSRLEIDLFGDTAFDAIDFGDAVNASGLLIAVDTEGGYLPNPGDSFQVLTAGGFTSTAGVTSFQDAGLIGLGIGNIVGSNSITIVVDNRLEADGNYDGIVDLRDFVILRNGFGNGDEFTEGDYNQDGVVDLQDFVVLRNNFGNSLGGLGGWDPSGDLGDLDRWRTTVPEPASALSLLGLAGLAMRRRR